MSAAFIEVRAGVRYWEDATINDKEDASGDLTPLRKGNNWCPTIRLDDGLVMNWPIGTKADIHFKVCDDGDYWLLDEDMNRIAKWGGYYVPDEFLCCGGTGYGDYIILTINEIGSIQSWKKPSIEWACDCDDDEAQHRWKRIAEKGGQHD